MTCIVGWVDPVNDSVYIGGDSLASTYDLAMQIRHPKIVHYGHMIIGASGRVGVLTALQQRVKPPKMRANEDVDTYVSLRLMGELRQRFKEAGLDDEHGWGELLIGIRGRLFLGLSDYSTVPLKESYHSVGSGTLYALGALAALHRVARDPEGKYVLEPQTCVITALQAAATWQPGAVGGDLYVQEVPVNGKQVTLAKHSKRRTASKARNRKGSKRRRYHHSDALASFVLEASRLENASGRS